MINRNPSVRIGFVVWLLGFWCASCSGTPFGEQLAERLSEPDDPVEESTVPNSAAVEISTEEQLATEPESESSDPVEETSPLNSAANTTATDDPPASFPSTSEQPPNAPQEALPSSLPTTIQSRSPLNPTPYRLLLRLPEADPAAPAEAVTQALRAAGILFEVETIERLPREPPPAATTPLASPP